MIEDQLLWPTPRPPRQRHRRSRWSLAPDGSTNARRTLVLCLASGVFVIALAWGATVAS